MPGPHSKSPFKLYYEHGFGHPPQYPQRFIHLFHYHPCFCGGTLKGLWMPLSHESKGNLLQSQIQSAQYRCLLPSIINYLFKEFNIYSCKQGQIWQPVSYSFAVPNSGGVCAKVSKNVFLVRDTLMNSLKFSIQYNSQRSTSAPMEFN